MYNGHFKYRHFVYFPFQQTGTFVCHNSFLLTITVRFREQFLLRTNLICEINLHLNTVNANVKCFIIILYEYHFEQICDRFVIAVVTMIILIPISILFWYHTRLVIIGQTTNEEVSTFKFSSSVHTTSTWHMTLQCSHIIGPVQPDVHERRHCTSSTTITTHSTEERAGTSSTYYAHHSFPRVSTSSFCFVFIKF